MNRFFLLGAQVCAGGPPVWEPHLALDPETAPPPLTGFSLIHHQ